MYILLGGHARQTIQTAGAKIEMISLCACNNLWNIRKFDAFYSETLCESLVSSAYSSGMA